MPIAPTAQVHPTALLSPGVEVAEEVRIGPFAVVEGHVQIGRGCVIGPHAHLCGPLVMGQENQVFTGAVLGERPQHLKYRGEPTGLEIGDHNVFREGVTIHRGTTHSWTTRVGSHNYFMANSHVGHDCVIGNRILFANGALVGGHCTIEDNAYLSGNCAVHQFVRVGRLALLSGCSVTTKDIPPFMMQQGFDNVVGVNVVGLRRAGISGDCINAIRRAFHILYREGHLIPVALARIEKELAAIDVITALVQFIRQSSRGINMMHDRRPEAA
ncbi:MAG TPA: acyl-ACP--UDP-N-acetylglucosamine O-acyltransferase [Gemmataceae bacterium]|jgi:UDP-N-acetylglucosamine acyltransferase|nr:acyl-ACP--UDP-N-acetylglucosamine O-acyltransferase [Gemmataceae bacterium]